MSLSCCCKPTPFHPATKSADGTKTRRFFRCPNDILLLIKVINVQLSTVINQWSRVIFSWSRINSDGAKFERSAERRALYFEMLLLTFSLCCSAVGSIWGYEAVTRNLFHQTSTPESCLCPETCRLFSAAYLLLLTLIIFSWWMTSVTFLYISRGGLCQSRRASSSLLRATGLTMTLLFQSSIVFTSLASLSSCPNSTSSPFFSDLSSHLIRQITSSQMTSQSAGAPFSSLWTFTGVSSSAQFFGESIDRLSCDMLRGTSPHMYSRGIMVQVGNVTSRPARVSATCDSQNLF